MLTAVPMGVATARLVPIAMTDIQGMGLIPRSKAMATEIGVGDYLSAAGGGEEREVMDRENCAEKCRNAWRCKCAEA